MTWSWDVKKGVGTQSESVQQFFRLKLVWQPLIWSQFTAEYGSAGLSRSVSVIGSDWSFSTCRLLFDLLGLLSGSRDLWPYTWYQLKPQIVSVLTLTHVTHRSVNETLKSEDMKDTQVKSLTESRVQSLLWNKYFSNHCLKFIILIIPLSIIVQLMLVLSS